MTRYPPSGGCGVVVVRRLAVPPPILVKEALGVTRVRKLDPELAALATLIPALDLEDVAQARQIERAVVAEMRRGAASGPIESHTAHRPDGSELAMSLHRPGPPFDRDRQRSALTGRGLPTLLFLHGGSFVTGGLHTEEERCQHYADAAGCAVLTVDYRLAPEHPYPAALDDSELALAWAVEHCEELNLDPDRIAIGGLSAGGALAAGVALRWRDAQRGDRDLSVQPQPLVLQLLLYPVLDGMLRTHSATVFEDTPIITGQHLRTCWAMYLGVDPADHQQREVAASAPEAAYASPGAVTDLTDLPPVYLAAAEFDPLRDEGLAYCGRLLAAGVAVELHHYARAFHSFDSFSATRLGRASLNTQVEALRDAFR